MRVFFERKKILAAAVAGLVVFTSAENFSEASLEDDKAGYEQQAEEKLRQSDELRTRINTVSEEKRLIDEEADAAIAEYRALKSDLDATLDRIDANEEQLVATQKNYERKHKILNKRVRDIYINGQISYLDVLFGAKDFQDLMTRMDLLKHVVANDYDLVQSVLADKQHLEEIQKELEKDKASQESQVEKAALAKDKLLLKQKKQKDMIAKLESDKATVDRQYDELMAASKQIEEMLRQSHAVNTMPPVSGSGAMMWPISGPITSEFGWRTHPIFGTQRYHSGLDIGGDYGLPIHAAQSGTVEYAGWISGYGNTVILNHGGGITTLYGHNQSLAVGVGQSVSQGDVIAYCGSTGNSTGPHCHFEVRVNGEPTSPHAYL